MKKMPVCPCCGASHWIESYCTSTLLYTPAEFINGHKVVQDDSNINLSYLHVRCLECGEKFDIRRKNGEYI